MKIRSAMIAVLVFTMVVLGAHVGSAEVKEMLSEMITVFSTSSKGVQDEAFLEKVKAVDEFLREKIERDHDLTPFKEVVSVAQEFKARASARKMFEVLLERVNKRLKFTKAQQEITDADLKNQMDEMVGQIERYLDPSLPDDDTVDRGKLEAQRKRLHAKIQAAHAAITRTDPQKRFSVEVLAADGGAGKLTPDQERNLLAKLRTCAPEPGRMGVKVTLKKDDLLDLHVFIQNFVAPNGFAVIEGELDFVDVSLKALNNTDASQVEDVMGDAHFKRYRCVQDEEQLNVLPQAGNAAYEMGSMASGQTWKMTFRKPEGISDVVKSLDGNEEILVVNTKTAVNDKAIEFRNNGSRNLMYLQGTDVTGLVSVKALGYLKARDGYTTFSNVLLVVDDQLSSDLTKYIGEQGINWFLRQAADNLKKGFPFTPVLENVSCERSSDGKMVYIFSGRGKNAL